MHYLIPLVAAAWWIGFLAKDSWDLTRPLYYIPAALIAIASVVWLLVYRSRAPLLLRGFVAATAIAAVAKVALLDTAWNPRTAPPASAIRLVHWNTAWGHFHPDIIWQTLASDRPDLVIFSEPPLQSFESDVRRLIPDVHFHVGASMALASRWPIEVVGSLVVPDVRSWHIRIALPGGPLDVLGVDLPSSPLRSRQRPLADVARWVLDHGQDVPLLVVGDFNTPRDSAALNPLRMLMSQAYESAGRGWPYSWPSVAPLWSIDQIWFSRGIRMHNHEYRFAGCSDHLRQVVQFELEPVPATKQADPTGS